MISPLDLENLKLKIFKVSFRNHQLKTCDFCYVSNILTVGSELVISFFNEGKSISPGLPFLHFCKK